MNQPFSPNDMDVKRGQNRDSLFVKAVLRFPVSGDEKEVRVRNISSGGLMAEAPLRTPRGDPIEVQLRNIGWVSGKVAWVAESRFGIAFDYPIDPKMLSVRESSGYEIPRYLAKIDQQSAAAKKPLRPL
ncbi:MAG: PilZ domain-containing protein [Sphingorhabdus sp.]|jgi:PilZ domain